MDKKDNEIKKPVTMLRDELAKNIVQTINHSGLPLFIIEYILKDIISEIHIAVQQQTESEKQNYQAQLKNHKQ